MTFEPTISLGGVVIFAGLVTNLISMTTQIRAWGKDHRETIKKLEEKVATFLTADQIDAKFEHALNNRLAAETAIDIHNVKQDEALKAVELDVERIKRDQYNFSNTLTEIRGMIKEQRDETREALNRLIEQVARINN